VRELDIEQIVALRRKGLDKVAEIARHLGIPKTTLLGEKHGEEVREAMERGRVAQKLDCLEAYETAIDKGNGNLTGLLIFKAKNVAGWTDRPGSEREIEVNEGARERIKAAVESLVAKYAKEGGAPPPPLPWSPASSLSPDAVGGSVPQVSR